MSIYAEGKAAQERIMAARRILDEARAGLELGYWPEPKPRKRRKALSQRPKAIARRQRGGSVRNDHAQTSAGVPQPVGGKRTGPSR